MMDLSRDDFREWLESLDWEIEETIGYEEYTKYLRDEKICPICRDEDGELIEDIPCYDCRDGVSATFWRRDRGMD